MAQDKNPEVVIGQPMADALARERSHRAAWSGPESAFADVRYDSSKGEVDLLRLRPATADARVEDFLAGVLGEVPENIADVRGSLSTDDFDTLITFARRSVVRALRGESANLISRALSGIALIDPARVDPRDLAWISVLSAWGAQRLDVPREDALRDARRVGLPAGLDALSRSFDARINLSDWGFVEVATAAGAGLAERGPAPYAPTSNLLDAALAIADAIAADRYEPPSLTIASNLPKVWFGKSHDTTMARALGEVRATIAIRSQPLPSAHREPATQMLLAFLSECASSRDATRLGTAAQQAAGNAHYAAVAVRGRFLAVLIARSVVVGIESLETEESVARFLPALTDALATR